MHTACQHPPMYNFKHGTMENKITVTQSHSTTLAFQFYTVQQCKNSRY